MLATSAAFAAGRMGAPTKEFKGGTILPPRGENRWIVEHRFFPRQAWQPGVKKSSCFLKQIVLIIIDRNKSPTLLTNGWN